MLRSSFTLALLLAIVAPAQAQDRPLTPASVIASALEEEWVTIASQDLLVMELAPRADGTERRVVIQLMPPPFSQPWVANIRTLAQAHWWDGKSVYRVVDNWVAQWGGGEGDDFPDRPRQGWVTSPEYRYESSSSHLTGPHSATIVQQLLDLNLNGDAYAERTGFLNGWPLGDDFNLWWPIHCYGSVGVARDLAPDTGTGSELYAVIGHAPRQLDRNIAVVGRVIEGMEHLSTLKRGTGDAGVYETRAEDTPILSVRLASELSDPPAFEYLDTSSESFARYVDIRANRNDAFYTVPAGGVDICNVQVPIRRVGEE